MEVVHPNDTGRVVLSGAALQSGSEDSHEPGGSWFLPAPSWKQPPSPSPASIPRRASRAWGWQWVAWDIFLLLWPCGMHRPCHDFQWWRIPPSCGPQKPSEPGRALCNFSPVSVRCSQIVRHLSKSVLSWSVQHS